eukprot:PhF_6_TR18079/c0_g1_i1/m.26922
MADFENSSGSDISPLDKPIQPPPSKPKPTAVTASSPTAPITVAQLHGGSSSNSTNAVLPKPVGSPAAHVTVSNAPSNQASPLGATSFGSLGSQPQQQVSPYVTLSA